MTRISLLLLIAASLTMQTACSRRDIGPDVPKSEAKALEATMQPVNIFDRDLRTRIASDTYSRERLDDGRMATAVNIRNRTRRPIHIQTRVVFKDANGISLGDESSWENLYLAPRQTVTLRTTSTINNAEMFTMEVRNPYIKPLKYKR